MNTATFDVAYPDRPLNRLTTAFRIFTAIPIVIVLCTIGNATVNVAASDERAGAASGTSLIVLAPVLMILFRQKYPRWWFDFNRELLRFGSRVAAYMALLTDVYPSTDEEQDVRLEIPYPDVPNELNRWLPLVKWLLAIPHYFVLFFLWIGAVAAVIGAWFAILFTGRYPRGLFDFVVGVARWHLRVVAYMAVLVTDSYPPFSLR